ncbi:unnamed protein product [Fraxinus pennsylvanica]|uniref:Niemann-Pick C1 N-terminal domain-containing protein n=1 Tax=Fraxinus pennsylvanica TaxID=56036 RepID=A0AAD1YT43_9LAMI|nr:unnamed protein product [Fraxinus pennsylvanica]
MSPNQSQFINETSVFKVRKNLTVDGIEFYITDTFGKGLFESCKDVKFGTMNTRAVDFVDGGAKNFREWYAFIGTKAGLDVLGSPYSINFLPAANESSGMRPMNVSTYSCGDTSLGCSCGDCSSSPICSNSAPPPHQKHSCSVRIGSLKAKCIEVAMAILYIILVSLFLGWGFFHRKRERSPASRHVNSKKDKNTPIQVLGDAPQTANRVQLSIVQEYMSKFFRRYGSWVARNPTPYCFCHWLLFLCFALLIIATIPASVNGKAPSIVTESNIKLLFDIQKKVDGIRANYFGTMVSLTDICMKPLGKDCATQSVLQALANRA